MSDAQRMAEIEDAACREIWGAVYREAVARDVLLRLGFLQEAEDMELRTFPKITSVLRRVADAKTGENL